MKKKGIWSYRFCNDHTRYIMKIENELKQLKKLLRLLSADINTIPSGVKLYLKAQGRYRYLIIRSKTPAGEKQDASVSQNAPRAKEYINTAYAQRTIPLLQAEIKALENFQQNYHPERKFETLGSVPAKMRSMVNHPIKSPQEEAREWAKDSFYTNPYPNENLEYTGKNGERFRSKAEYIIANILYELDIPFRYECEYTINGKIVFPDFTILNPNTGELFYIEYFGLMDDPDYAQNALKKISLYQQSPDSGKFIYFFESAYNPMNTKGIRNTIIKTLQLEQ